MTNYLKRKFTISINKKSNKTIFFAWIKKIFFFNSLNLISLLIGILITYFILPNIVNFFILPFIILYFLLINVLYISSSLIIIITNIVQKDLVNISSFATLLFIVWGFIGSILPFFICMFDLILNIP